MDLANSTIHVDVYMCGAAAAAVASGACRCPRPVGRFRLATALGEGGGSRGALRRRRPAGSRPLAPRLGDGFREECWLED